MNTSNSDQINALSRSVGLSGAVMMGLGSILGTGVFVSLGLAAGSSGTSIVVALFLAGVLALCNGLSSAQLAASHPVSGGTYEYAYRYIHPLSGYISGVLFIAAKTASAASAAIGFGGYFLHFFNIGSIDPWQIGLVAVAIITMVCLKGIKRTSIINTIIVMMTIFSLLFFIVMIAGDIKLANFFPFFKPSIEGKGLPVFSLLESTALMFVAYTGYGRVATLGEEIKNPKENIPKAIVITLFISFIIYILVALTAIGAVGSEYFYRSTLNFAAPLEMIALQLKHPILAKILGLGAMSAMLGVLLNLILGISRVFFAMGKRGDLPPLFKFATQKQKVPLWSVLVTSVCIVILLCLLKSIKITWAFSAFTVLVYYAFTNLSALKLPRGSRLYSQSFSWLGFLGCLFLSFWVDKEALLLGLGVIMFGLLWRFGYRSLMAVFFLCFILPEGLLAAEFSNESEVSIVKTGGNSNIKTYQMKTAPEYKFGANKLSLKGQYIYGESGGTRNAEAWSVLGRYDRELNAKFSLFLGELIEANRFAGIDRRYNTDLGVKYKVIENDKNITFVEAGYRYTIEQPENSSQDLKDQKGRVYAETKYKLSSNASFKYWVEYIPNFTESTDYLVSMEPSLTADLNKLFSMKTAYKWAYDNKPIVGNSKYDYTYTVSLLANF